MKLSDLTAHCERERLVDPELFVEAPDGHGLAIAELSDGLFIRDGGRTTPYLMLTPKEDDDDAGR